MKYKVTVPPTMEQGSFSTIAEANNSETLAKNALWDYNSAREHDGQPPLKRMPNGTKYKKLYKYTIHFEGRKAGAIGIFHNIIASRVATDEESAIFALYNEFEHIKPYKIERDKSCIN